MCRTPAFLLAPSEGGGGVARTGQLARRPAAVGFRCRHAAPNVRVREDPALRLAPPPLARCAFRYDARVCCSPCEMHHRAWWSNRSCFFPGAPTVDAACRRRPLRVAGKLIFFFVGAHALCTRGTHHPRPLRRAACRTALRPRSMTRWLGTGHPGWYDAAHKVPPMGGLPHTHSCNQRQAL